MIDPLRRTVGSSDCAPQSGVGYLGPRPHGHDFAAGRDGVSPSCCSPDRTHCPALIEHAADYLLGAMILLIIAKASTKACH